MREDTTPSRCADACRSRLLFLWISTFSKVFTLQIITILLMFGYFKEHVLYLIYVFFFKVVYFGSWKWVPIFVNLRYSDISLKTSDPKVRDTTMYSRCILVRQSRAGWMGQVNCTVAVSDHLPGLKNSLFFEIGSCCVALTGLEFVAQSSCLCLCFQVLGL